MATLLLPPYRMTREEIRGYTDDELLALLFCPRDDEGRPLDEGEIEDERKEREAEARGEVVHFACYRQHFWHWFTRKGLTEAQILERWEDYCRKNPGTDAVLDKRFRKEEKARGDSSGDDARSNPEDHPEG